MLGLRLDPDLEGRLDRFAAEQRRTRSDIAREAVREYLDRHSLEEEYRRQIRILRDSTTQKELDELDAATDDWLRMLDEEDGGYDWGEDGPPQ